MEISIIINEEYEYILTIPPIRITNYSTLLSSKNLLQWSESSLVQEITLPAQHQGITSTVAHLFLTGPWGTNITENSIAVQDFY